MPKVKQKEIYPNSKKDDKFFSEYNRCKNCAEECKKPTPEQMRAVAEVIKHREKR